MEYKFYKVTSTALAVRKQPDVKSKLMDIIYFNQPIKAEIVNEYWLKTLFNAYVYKKFLTEITEKEAFELYQSLNTGLCTL